MCSKILKRLTSKHSVNHQIVYRSLWTKTACRRLNVFRSLVIVVGILICRGSSEVVLSVSLNILGGSSCEVVLFIGCVLVSGSSGNVVLRILLFVRGSICKVVLLVSGIFPGGSSGNGIVLLFLLVIRSSSRQIILLVLGSVVSRSRLLNLAKVNNVAGVDCVVTALKR
ncbi:hypothetical protein BJ742DRAFT_821998 [Cladochytrium replicatum]|nr:hypothetical protein BJ742DRAFT_821998 [Cladochytrium replicatum]